MKYLITGASGFIGFHLAKKLSSSNKNKVYLVDNFLRGKKDKDFLEIIKKKNVVFLNLDLTKKISYKKFNPRDSKHKFDYTFYKLEKN